MYKLANAADVPRLLAYFEQDLKHCLYSYIDLKKYGITNPHLHIYYTEKDGLVTATATEYYKGIQLFSLEETVDVPELLELCERLDVPMINAKRELIEYLQPHFPGFHSEFGYVAWMPALKPGADLTQATAAGVEDTLEIAKLICSDEGLGGHYIPEEFAEELADRLRENFGRNYVIKIDGKIVSHAATYAELDNLAIVSGVITDESCRGMGLGYKTVSKLCSDLLDEGKRPCIFYFKREAEGLYRKVGFEEPTGWGKLSRNH